MMGFECRFRRECRVIQARLLLSYKARRWQFRGSRLTANYGPGILIHPNGPDVRETGPRKQRLSFKRGENTARSLESCDRTRSLASEGTKTSG